MLRSVLYGLSNNTGGEMLETDGGLPFVAVLTARARRLERVHLALSREFLVRQFQVAFPVDGVGTVIVTVAEEAAAEMRLRL
uniref:Uncharacterized protein LOC105107329 isoform X2 n=1 Tax=Rhizophora mucronata TaxID=61149 RepID=A0A2P2K5A2_RHIMU